MRHPQSHPHPPLRPLPPVRHSTANLPPAGLDVGRFPATAGPTADLLQDARRALGSLQQPSVFAGLTLRTSPGLEC
jgi:hypothetical protein